MLRFLGDLMYKPIRSLRSGVVIGEVTSPIIDMNTLTVASFYVKIGAREELVLHPDDIREYGPLGFIIDDEEVLMETSDLIKLKKIIDEDFDIFGKKVVTERRRRVGKIDDVAIDNQFVIQKLYVGQSLLSSFSSSQKIIGRKQIVDVSEKKITVKSPDEKVKKRVPATNPVN